MPNDDDLETYAPISSDLAVDDFIKLMLREGEAPKGRVGPRS